MNTVDKRIVESNDTPLQQLYKICARHLMEMGYKFKLEFEHENQVVIDMGKNGYVDFFMSNTNGTGNTREN